MNLQNESVANLTGLKILSNNARTIPYINLDIINTIGTTFINPQSSIYNINLIKMNDSNILISCTHNDEISSFNKNLLIKYYDINLTTNIFEEKDYVSLTTTASVFSKSYLCKRNEYSALIAYNDNVKYKVSLINIDNKKVYLDSKDIWIDNF
jgi:hypothetical protein